MGLPGAYYYSSALAVYNQLFEARQLLATFDDDTVKAD